MYPCWLQDTKLYASHGPINTDIGLLMTENMLRGPMSLVSNYIKRMDVYGYGDNLMNPWTLHVSRVILADDGSVMVRDICSWSYMGLLICLDRTLTDRWHVCMHPGWSPASNHVHWAFQWTWEIPARQCDTPPVQNCFRNTLLSLNTSASHQIPQTWTLLNISGMLCNVLFRKGLHGLTLLRIYVQPCRMYGVNSVQHYFRH